MGKILIVIGGLIVLVGILALANIPIPLGRLPEDLVFSGKNGTIYLPITTSILISIVLSVLFYLLRD